MFDEDRHNQRPRGNPHVLRKAYVEFRERRSRAKVTRLWPRIMLAATWSATRGARLFVDKRARHSVRRRRPSARWIRRASRRSAAAPYALTQLWRRGRGQRGHARSG
jgi:hypothetical protein